MLDLLAVNLQQMVEQLTMAVEVLTQVLQQAVILVITEIMVVAES
jgi:hypothetical protein